MAEITLRQLEYFVSILESGSVTAAAKRSQISQAAMSMAIAQLEHAFKADLLIRKRSKGVAPTPAGVELATRARQVLGLVGEMEGAVAGQEDRMHGSLRVGCMSSTSPRILPALIDHFAGRFPGVDISFREGGAVDLQEQMLEGRLDVCFVYGLQTIPGVDVSRLVDIRQQLMLAADHPLAGQDSVSFADVADEWAILLDMPPSLDRAVALITAAGVQPRPRWCRSNPETIRSLVARGLGYSVAVARPDIALTYDNRRVVYKPIADDLPDNALVAAVPEGIRPVRRVREAIDFCRELLAP
jgi:DNA-binding transcriptional LysR family regulator